MTPTRLVDIALLAERVRQRCCKDLEKIDVGILLDRLAITESGFDYRIVEAISGKFEGAFAYIAGHRDGHTVVLEESRLSSALKGVHFARHVIAHEVGHHFLHPHLLVSENLTFIEPQQLSRNRCTDIGSQTQIEQVIDSIEEAEAELFATLLLVPWTAFYKGTQPLFLADDFGEQKKAVGKVWDYLRLDVVKDAFRMNLWESGQRKHMIFEIP